MDKEVIVGTCCMCGHRTEILIPVREALEAKPERVQSNVQPQEAAPMPSESNHSAGRETCSIEEVERYVKDRLASWKDCPTEQIEDNPQFYIEKIRSEYQSIVRTIEARRRSTGCA